MIHWIVSLIAIEHVGFLILEMVLWQHPLGLKALKMDATVAKISAPLAKNQGLYNGFLAAGLVWSLMHPNSMVGLQIQIFFLSCILIAGIYGALTANRLIFLIQGLPALVALILLKVH